MRVVHEKILTSTESVSIAIASTATVYTKSFLLGDGDTFGLFYKLAGAGPDVKIELEQGPEKPATEGSSSATWVVAEGASNIETSLTNTTQHHQDIAPTTGKWGRLKITGAAGNGADTVLTAWIAKQIDID